MNEMIHFTIIMLGLAYLGEKIAKLLIFVYEYFYGEKARRRQQQEVAELEKGIAEKQLFCIDQVKKINMISMIVPGIISYLRQSAEYSDMSKPDGRMEHFERFVNYYQEIRQQHEYISEDLDKIVSPIFEQMKKELN